MPRNVAKYSVLEVPIVGASYVRETFPIKYL